LGTKTGQSRHFGQKEDQAIKDHRTDKERLEARVDKEEEAVVKKDVVLEKEYADYRGQGGRACTLTKEE